MSFYKNNERGGARSLTELILMNFIKHLLGLCSEVITPWRLPWIWQPKSFHILPCLLNLWLVICSVTTKHIVRISCEPVTYHCSLVDLHSYQWRTWDQSLCLLIWSHCTWLIFSKWVSWKTSTAVWSKDCNLNRFSRVRVRHPIYLKWNILNRTFRIWVWKQSMQLRSSLTRNRGHR